MSRVGYLCAIALLSSSIVSAQAATPQRYAVICTVSCPVTQADGVTVINEPAGYVINAILWDGVAIYSPGVGLELKRSDTLQIGQITTP